jgi:DNA-binding FadR family transcriptional regulator
VVAALVDRIVGGQLEPGASLPTEPALSQAFGVSRVVIREAVKLLEEKGLARVRQGHGTTVTPRDEWNLLDPVVLEATIRHDDAMAILDDLIDVRVALECDMVRSAAERMTGDDLAALGGLLGELESELTDPGPYQETDTRFHDLILRCSGNQLGRSIIRSIHPYARASTRYNPSADEEDIRRSHVGHVAIYEHLVRRDGDAASAAMEEHIRGTWALRKQKRRP